MSQAISRSAAQGVAGLPGSTKRAAGELMRRSRGSDGQVAANANGRDIVLTVKRCTNLPLTASPTPGRRTL